MEMRGTYFLSIGIPMRYAKIEPRKHDSSSPPGLELPFKQVYATTADIKGKAFTTVEGEERHTYVPSKVG